MKKFLFNLIVLLTLSVFTSADLLAANAKIVMTTDAPAGTRLRIFPNIDIVQDIIVSGADKGTFAGDYFSKGPGSEITLSGDGLTQLEVYGCQLTSLTVVEAPELFILKCYNNELTELNVAACSKLEVLDCHNNKIQTLDVTNNTILEQLYASDNRLTDLKVGRQPSLKYLDCAVNSNLEVLDIAQCTNLEELHFNDCQLSNLDLSNNPNLSWVFAYNNGIAGEKMNQFVTNMPEGYNSRIYIVNTFADSESNVCTMDNVREFAKKSWITMDYINGGGEGDLGKFYPGSDYVPTVGESRINFTTTRSAGEKITLYISSTASLTIDGVKEPVATGRNTYTLTASSVTISGDVTEFECPDNDITYLTFSEPALLKRLECQNNHITKLEIKDAKALTQVYAQNNNLSSLNLKGCTALLRVDCYQNNLYGSKMTSFVNSLCTSTEDPYLFIIDTKSSKEHNIANTNQVNIAKEKGWSVYDYDGGANYGLGTKYNGSEPTGDELPEEYFSFTRTSMGDLSFNVVFCDEEANSETKQPIVEGATILGWNGKGLMLDMTDETVTVYGDIEGIEMLLCDIEDIDVTNLPNLKELNFALNDIRNIDLTENSKLEMLSCECNLLESLDFSGNPELYYVNCFGNLIKGKAMTDMMESLPLRTKEHFGTLIVRDVTYTQNANICLKSDVSIGLKKYWATFELNDTDLVQYDGEDPAGIENVSAESNALQYDAASSIVFTATPSTIEIFNTSGVILKKAENACELSTADLPTGIYIVRCGNQVIKIVK